MGAEIGIAPAPRPHAERREPGSMEVKTYVVLQRHYRRDRHQPNVRIVAVKLTQAAAQSVVDATPGTWWERHYANKRSPEAIVHPVATPAAKGSRYGD